MVGDEPKGVAWLWFDEASRMDAQTLEKAAQVLGQGQGGWGMGRAATVPRGRRVWRALCRGARRLLWNARYALNLSRCQHGLREQECLVCAYYAYALRGAFPDPHPRWARAVRTWLRTCTRRPTGG
jgi:hypothetical protein